MAVPRGPGRRPPSGITKGDVAKASTASGQATFLLSGSLSFGPHYVPTRISVTKERELDRQGNFCGGEDVTDLGSKNRDIHVSGIVLEVELETFETLLDNEGTFDLITSGWSGEVRVAGGEYEGPVGFDGSTRQHLFKYSIDLVSTGPEAPVRESEETTRDPRIR